MKRTVAVIGLGGMGSGMARALVHADFDVHGYDIHSSARSSAEEYGVTAADSIQAAADRAEAGVIIAVRTGREVSAVVDALVSATGEGRPVLVTSTIEPEDASVVCRDLTVSGYLPLSAPLSGGPWGAAAGTLTVMAAGTEAAFERARPLLDAIGSRIYFAGQAPGAAAAAKLGVQLIYCVNMVALFEALRLGLRHGVSETTLLDIISRSVGQSWVAENWHHVREWWQGGGVGLEILVKDVRGALADADRMGLPLPITSVAFQRLHRVWDTAVAEFPPLPDVVELPTAWH